MARIRIALAQINQTVGAFDSNLDKLLSYASRANDENADLVVFPELSICGYPPEDLVLRDDFAAECEARMKQFAKSASSTAAVVGSVHPIGESRYNSAFFCHDGRVVSRYDKRQLPNYAVFDEGRTFQRGNSDLELFEIAGIRVGVVVCEDAWVENGISSSLSDGGAELVVVVNASPFVTGRVNDRMEEIKKRIAETGCAVAYVNAVGGQDELVFDGGSFIFDAESNLVGQAEQFVEELLVCDLEIAQPEPVRSVSLPLHNISENTKAGERIFEVLATVLGRVEEIRAALVLCLEDYVKKNKFDSVVIGLSGGIDSSVVAALACEALGSDKVKGILMPSPYTSDESNFDAEQLAKNLGIETFTLPIAEAMAAFESTLAPTFATQQPDLTEENIQSRIRGTLLMALSNKFGWLVLTTSNKSESAVGYSTLYGDTAGGFGVIKDVLKTDVYRLAELINADEEIIPTSVLEKAPSAELRPDQLDSDSLPPYEILDRIITEFVENDRGVAEFKIEGVDAQTVERVVGLINKSEYKRRQMPPGPRISRKAFGRDRRLPITSQYDYRP